MKRQRQLLEAQADRIEMVLSQYGAPARVTGGTLFPRWTQFNILPRLGTKVGQIHGLARELALTLHVTDCRISQSNEGITLQIPRDDPQTVRLLPLQRRLSRERPIPFGTALLGLDETGAPLLVRLPSPQVAHLLIAGTTGSGKSALMLTLIASLALSHRQSQMGFVLIDPKRRAFGSLAGLPHLLRPVLSEPEEITHTLQALVQLMLDRDRQGKQAVGAERNGEPRVVVVIDELADLVAMTGQETQQALTRLAQRGREAGIHLVVGTQKPAIAVVGSLARANFPLRLVGRVTSPEEAKIATGYAGTGAECLRGPGDFVAVAGGQVTRFQAAYIPAREIGEIVKQMGAREGGPAVWLPEPIVAGGVSVTDKIAGYVDKVRGLWPTLTKADGSLKWGAKADLAEAIHGQRSTAGSYGRTVDQVIARLREESKKKAPENTTTTTLSGAIRAFLRPRGSYKVVVVVSGAWMVEGAHR